MHPKFIIGPVLCACGCGGAILPTSDHRYRYGTPRYISGHHSRVAHPMQGRGDVRQDCRHCGQEFVSKRHRQRIYCSQACYDAARQARIERVCVICGAHFSRYRSEFANGTSNNYCSKRCYWKHCRAGYRSGPAHPLYGRRGPLAPNWQGGKTPDKHRQRTSTEHRAWRRAVLLKDKNACQRCGATKGRLHAHHVIGFMADPSRRYEVGNGMTLCEACHLAVHHRGAGVQLALC